MKNDRDLSPDIKKAIVSMGFIEDYLRWHLASQENRAPLFWGGILTYETGEVVQHIVYNKAYGGKKWNKEAVELAIGEVIVNAMVTALACDIDPINGVQLALEQIAAREWKNKVNR